MLSKGLFYARFGSPSDEVYLATKALEKIDGILCRFLASPINPSDLNQISGRYPVQPSSLPAVAGNEGVAEVVDIFASGQNPQFEAACVRRRFAIGDRVIARRPGVGTWRDFAILQESDLFPGVPKDLPLELACSLQVNLPTAYRLLRDFGVKPGDYIVQNAATSVVGQLIIQLSRIWGIHTVNIVRSRPSEQETLSVKKQLIQLGATLVFTEEELVEAEALQQMQEIHISHAFNAVGGASAAELVKLLGKDGVCVTYGAMGNRPFSVSATSLIYRNVRVLGFWMTEWYKAHSDEQRQEMLQDIYWLVKKHGISLQVKKHRLEDFSAALRETLQQSSDDGGFLLRKKHVFIPADSGQQ